MEAKYATCDKTGRNYTAVYTSHVGGFTVVQRPVCDDDAYDYLHADTLGQAKVMCDAWQEWIDGLPAIHDFENNPWDGHSRHI